MKHNYQAAMYGSQPDSQFNPLSNPNKFHFDSRTGMSPRLSQNYSQRSVGQGVGLQRSNPANRPSQLSMSQVGAVSQTQQQAYGNRPLSSSCIPAGSQPALSGVFRPGSAPQRPTASQLEVPAASQWTSAAVTSNFVGVGHHSNNNGGLLQHLATNSNQHMPRPRPAPVLRTAAAPHMQGRPGSAPGLLSGATASPVHIPKQQHQQSPSFLMPSQHHHGNHQPQQRPINHQGSQGGLGFNLLGSQQQDFPAIQASQQQVCSSNVLLDDGSAGTGITLDAEPAAGVPAAAAVQQQQQQCQQQAAGGSTANAALNRLGPRLRGLLQGFPAASQLPEQYEPPQAAQMAAAGTAAAVGNTATAAEPPQPGNSSFAVHDHMAACNTAAATAAAVPLQAIAPASSDGGPAAGPVGPSAAAPALDPQLVLQRISSLEDHCSSMNKIIERDVPLLLQQQDSTNQQFKSLLNNNNSNHAALETRLQELSSSVASFMNGLRAWQQEQEQQVQVLQEQAAKKQPQLLLSSAACQTSPGLLGGKQHAAGTAEDASTAAAAGMAEPGTAAAAEPIKAAPQAVLSPSGARYSRARAGGIGYFDAYQASRQTELQERYTADSSQPTCPVADASIIQAQHLQPDNAAARPAAPLPRSQHQMLMNSRIASVNAAAIDTTAAAADIAVEADQDVDNAGDEDDGEEAAANPAPQQNQKRTRQPKKKPAGRGTQRKPAAKPRGRTGKAAAAAATKAAKAKAEADVAAAAATVQPQEVATIAVTAGGSGKQPSSNLVQSKLNFGKRLTRSVAAKDAAAVEAAVDASLKAVTACGPLATAAGMLALVPASPNTAASTDPGDSMDGVAAPTVTAPAAGEAAEPPPDWFARTSSSIPGGQAQQQKAAAGRLGRLPGAVSSRVPQQPMFQASGAQQRSLPLTPATATAAAAAAAASGTGRQFQRRTTPPPAGVGLAATAARPAKHHDQYSDIPASPPAAHAAAGPGGKPPATANFAGRLPPMQGRRTQAAPAAGPGEASVGAANRTPGRPAASWPAPPAAAGACSGFAKPAGGRIPLAARSGAGTEAAIAARPTYSGTGGFVNRPRFSGRQQHQQQRRVQGQARGGASRLLGMKRDRPEPAAAPARSSVVMLFGEMDSDSMDCVLEDDSRQQQVATGPMHRGSAAAQQGSAGRKSGAGTGGIATARAPTGMGTSTHAATDVHIDDDDIAQQVAARMAQHRSKQRRVAGPSGGFAAR